MKSLDIDNPSTLRTRNRKSDAQYLLKYFLLANFLQYLEAGAVPAMLLALSSDFEMPAGLQGLLGGSVYVALGCGGPIAGYLLRRFEHRTVVGTALILNNILTLIWAFTPVQQPYSVELFIGLRFLMGLCQCVVCVFLPLWINEYAPSSRRTSWMSYVQVVFFMSLYLQLNL